MKSKSVRRQEGCRHVVPVPVCTLDVPCVFAASGEVVHHSRGKTWSLYLAALRISLCVFIRTLLSCLAPVWNGLPVFTGRVPSFEVSRTRHTPQAPSPTALASHRWQGHKTRLLVFISFPIFNHQMCERSRPQACLNNWTSVQYSTIALSYSMHKTCPGSRKHRERKRKGAICNWMYFLLQ